jgi:hypothetical protein
MPAPYSFPTDRVTGGPSPAADVNALGAALNEADDAATASVLVLRDAAGRAQFADPSAAADAATKGYVDTEIAGVGGGGGGGQTPLFLTPTITAGRVRIGQIRAIGEWQYVEQDLGYFYPVYYEAPFTLDAFGQSLRGSQPGATARVGLYDSSNGGLPGVPVAQTTYAMDSSGWKSLSVTAVGPNPAGWYWHASTFNGRTDVYAGYMGWNYDAISIEQAVRDDIYGLRGFMTTGAFTTFTTNPTIQPNGSKMPVLGVRFA